MIDLPAIDSIERTRDGARESLTLRFVVPAASRYFEGHFPGVPLLPGVVQIGWAIELARRHMSRSAQTGLLGFRSLSGVKFTHVIQPGEQLSLRLTHEPPAQLAFEFHTGDVLCSTGRVSFH